MKALSIIGIVLSCIAVLQSIIVITTSVDHPDLYTGGYFSYAPNKDAGTFLLIISLYFLSFSIVTTVKSFKKKKNDNTIKN